MSRKVILTSSGVAIGLTITCGQSYDPFTCLTSGLKISFTVHYIVFFKQSSFSFAKEREPHRLWLYSNCFIVIGSQAFS